MKLQKQLNKFQNQEKKFFLLQQKNKLKKLLLNQSKAANMPYITERWSGGMLTNFPTIRKAVKKMTSIDKMATDGTFENISKRERLQITRQRTKLDKVLGSIADMSKLACSNFCC